MMKGDVYRINIYEGLTVVGIVRRAGKDFVTSCEITMDAETHEVISVQPNAVRAMNGTIIPVAAKNLASLFESGT